MPSLFTASRSEGETATCMIYSWFYSTFIYLLYSDMWHIIAVTVNQSFLTLYVQPTNPLQPQRNIFAVFRWRSQSCFARNGAPGGFLRNQKNQLTVGPSRPSKAQLQVSFPNSCRGKSWNVYIFFGVGAISCRLPWDYKLKFAGLTAWLPQLHTHDVVRRQATP